MKKRIIYGFALAAITTGIVGFRLAQSQNERSLTDLEIENIEALTDTEKKTYQFVTYIEYSWGWGCNCSGTGNQECC